MFLAKLDEIWLKTPPIRRRLISKLLENLKDRGVKASFYDTRIIGEGSIDVVSKTFGIKKVYQAISMPKDIKIWLDFLAKKMDKNKTYRLLVHRGDKSFPGTSPEIAAKLARELEKRGFKLSLDKYDETFIVEIRRDVSFLLWDEREGVGGLPYGSQGKALALFSGGIDSPVAAWMIAKRGVGLDYFYFSHCNCLDEAVLKVWEYLKDNWGMVGSFYVFNGKEVVEWIKEHIPRKYRMVVFKALLYSISSHMANKLGAHALVTGESLNQVSTQTLGTLPAISKFTSLLVLRPLIGMDKEETKTIARKVGTLPLSEKVSERCSLAKKVVTTVSFKKLKELLKNSPFINEEFVLSRVEVVK